jgi:hypothetical protein
MLSGYFKKAPDDKQCCDLVSVSCHSILQFLLIRMQHQFPAMPAEIVREMPLSAKSGVLPQTTPPGSAIRKKAGKNPRTGIMPEGFPVLDKKRSGDSPERGISRYFERPDPQGR